MSDVIPAWYPVTPAQERAEVRRALGKELAEAFAAVDLVVLDADGILTDGRLVYGPQGESRKVFDAKDGLGLVLLRAGEVKRAVLTGRNSAIVARRAGELHFEAVKLGRFDKAAALDEILAETETRAERTLYMGDDLIDMAAMVRVGLPVTVREAPEVVRGTCRYITSASGGAGAVRQVADLVLGSRGMLGTALGRLQDPRWRPSGPDLSSDETE